MKVLAISFSQNTETKQSNSVQVAHAIKRLMEDQCDVSVIEIAKYDMVPCMLCKSCVETGACHKDKEFMNVYDEVNESDLFFFIVPYYSPFPSKLMITLEKMNQLFYARSLINKGEANFISNKRAALIVHGGMVDGLEVREHYRRMIADPLKNILSGIGFNVIEENNRFRSGFTFGIEDKSSIIHKDDDFPDVVLTAEYIEKTIKPFIDFISSEQWN